MYGRDTKDREQENQWQKDLNWVREKNAGKQYRYDIDVMN